MSLSAREERALSTFRHTYSRLQANQAKVRPSARCAPRDVNAYSRAQHQLNRIGKLMWEIRTQ